VHPQESVYLQNLPPPQKTWKVGDAIGVPRADDRIEPVEAALLALASCVTEAITLDCPTRECPWKRWN